jgi:hypothetical protein
MDGLEAANIPCGASVNRKAAMIVRIIGFLNKNKSPFGNWLPT